MVSLLAACKKDFLDVVPTDRLSEEALLADSTLFESFVNRFMPVPHSLSHRRPLNWLGNDAGHFTRNGASAA